MRSVSYLSAETNVFVRPKCDCFVVAALNWFHRLSITVDVDVVYYCCVPSPKSETAVLVVHLDRAVSLVFSFVIKSNNLKTS